MYIGKDTLDGLLRQVFGALLAEDRIVTASRGNFKEAFGACLHLTNPLARLSRSESKGKVYSALGEFLWYLSKGTRLDFIDYYVPGRFQEESDDGVTVRSGYGERLQAWRGTNQLDNVIQLLRAHRSSRRATIQLFDSSDLAERYASIPCTCTLQFLIRDDQLPARRPAQLRGGSHPDRRSEPPAGVQRAVHRLSRRRGCLLGDCGALRRLRCQASHPQETGRRTG